MWTKFEKRYKGSNAELKIFCELLRAKNTNKFTHFNLGKTVITIESLIQGRFTQNKLPD